MEKLSIGSIISIVLLGLAFIFILAWLIVELYKEYYDKKF